ncbi:MAG: hypothetical protein Roseis2KO_53070 [Roseivirga sp.]
MITKEQHQQINDFLKEVKVDQQEIHDEFYDHIATSYEHQLSISPNIELKWYLTEVILPEFGGKNGIAKTINAKRREVNNFYRNKLWQHIKSFLRWPTILIVVSVYLILFKSLEMFDGKKVIAAALIMGTGLPLIVAMYGQISFFIHCKLKKLPYYSSIKNGTLIIYALLFGAVPNIYNVFFDNLESFPPSHLFVGGMTLFLTAYLVFALSYLKMMKEDFDFKLAYS